MFLKKFLRFAPIEIRRLHLGHFHSRFPNGPARSWGKIGRSSVTKNENAGRVIYHLEAKNSGEVGFDLRVQRTAVRSLGGKNKVNPDASALAGDTT